MDRSMRALPLALGAACLAAPAFVASSGSRASGAALRGVPQPGAVASPQLSSLAPQALGLTAVGTVLAAVAAAPRRARRSALKASIMADAGAAEEEEEPKEVEEVAKPPPPPFDPAQQVGATDPLGFFDPLGFSKVGDEEGFNKLRSAELKHGRVAMMAALGAIVQHFARIPIFFDYIPSGVSAAWSSNGKYGFVFLFLISGFLELFQWTDEGREPGNFGDPLGLGIYDRDMRNRELNNGRFAMFAAIGIIAAELYTGKDACEQLGMGPSMFM